MPRGKIDWEGEGANDGRDVEAFGGAQLDVSGTSYQAQINGNAVVTVSGENAYCYADTVQILFPGS